MESNQEVKTWVWPFRVGRFRVGRCRSNENLLVSVQKLIGCFSLLKISFFCNYFIFMAYLVNFPTFGWKAGFISFLKIYSKGFYSSDLIFQLFYLESFVLLFHFDRKSINWIPWMIRGFSVDNRLRFFKKFLRSDFLFFPIIYFFVNIIFLELDSIWSFCVS